MNTAELISKYKQTDAGKLGKTLFNVMSLQGSVYKHTKSYFIFTGSHPIADEIRHLHPQIHKFMPNMLDEFLQKSKNSWFVIHYVEPTQGNDWGIEKIGYFAPLWELREWLNGICIDLYGKMSGK